MIDFSTVIKGDSFNQIYRDVLRTVMNKGIKSKPRNMGVYELLNCSIILKNPRHRLLESNVRKHNYSFACGEFFWYLRGSNSLEEMMFYLPRMKDYSDNGKTLNSAYGERIFGKHKDFSDQWMNVLLNLMDDSDSRQAVITINYSHDLDKKSKDVPCTLNMQFLIRDNKLHLIVRMRSNDSYMGLIYDVFSFTLFHEMMYNDLKVNLHNLELGQYIHNAGSMHLYERDLAGAKAVCSENIGALGQRAITNFQLEDLSFAEKRLRKKGMRIDNKLIYSNSTYDWIIDKLNRQLTK